MKDYRISVKVRNNRILKAIEESGGSVGSKWCKEHGLPYTIINDYINMTISPLDREGTFKESAQKLCDVLNKLPDELWSNEQLYPLEKNFSEMEMDYEQVMALLPSEEQSYLPDFSGIENKQITNAVNKALLTLKPNERAVLVMRYDDEFTLEQIGDRMDITRERVRQIEARALRNLRHPARAYLLADCMDDNDANRIKKTRWAYLKSLTSPP